MVQAFTHLWGIGNNRVRRTTGSLMGKSFGPGNGLQSKSPLADDVRKRKDKCTMMVLNVSAVAVSEGFGGGLGVLLLDSRLLKFIQSVSR